MNPRPEDITQLSALSEVPPGVISSLAFCLERRYRRITYPKRNGGTRIISIPTPSLMKIQRTIARHILSNADIHAAAVGFREGMSIKSHVEPHLNTKDFAKFDISDCFGSIDRQRVEFIFLNLGFSPEFSYILSQLSTDGNALPQGAPTSPMLCNNALRNLDESIENFCKIKMMKYTRYADDILISGGNISFKDFRKIKKLIESDGFQTNEKSRLMREPKRIIICGISVSTGELKIPKTYKRELRKDCHFLLKSGDFSEFYNVIDKSFDPLFADRVLGKLNFWKFIEPSAAFPQENIPKMRDLINALLGEEIPDPAPR